MVFWHAPQYFVHRSLISLPAAPFFSSIGQTCLIPHKTYITKRSSRFPISKRNPSERYAFRPRDSDSLMWWQWSKEFSTYFKSSCYPRVLASLQSGGRILVRQLPTSWRFTLHSCIRHQCQIVLRWDLYRTRSRCHCSSKRRSGF